MRSFAAAMGALGLFVATPAGAIDCETAPPIVLAYLKANSDWSVVRLSDFGVDDQRLWQKYRANQCPGIAIVDLDGSGKSTYAVALLRHEAGKIFEKVVLITSTKSVSIVPAGEVARPAVVWRGLPGVYVDFYSRHKTRISHDTIVYEQLESWAISHYLSHGKFRSIQTSD